MSEQLGIAMCTSHSREIDCCDILPCPAHMSGMEWSLDPSVFRPLHQAKGIYSVNQECRCTQCLSKLMFPKATGITREHSEKCQAQSATVYIHDFFSTRVVKVWNEFFVKRHSSGQDNKQTKSCFRRYWRGHPDLYN